MILRLNLQPVLKGKVSINFLLKFDHVQKEEEGWDNEFVVQSNEVMYIPANIGSWYYEMKYYLQHELRPTYLDSNKSRASR